MTLHHRICIVLLLLTGKIFAQSEFTFIPGRLLHPPFRASLQEPRVGLRKDFATSRLKVDIGASVDMLEFRPGSDSTQRFRAGIDFFTYALSTNSEGLRLQIDAVDGYFGGHVSYVNELSDGNRLSARLRLLHLSAHFLDGHYNLTNQKWKDGREPIPFTRDYGELTGSYAFGGIVVCQLYGGFSYATLVRPVTIRRFEFLGGIELHSSKMAGEIFGKPLNIYLADHISVRGIPSYIGTNNLEAGVKFGEWNLTGLRIFASYYNGLDVFSQYFDQRREDWGWGIAFDFW